MSYVVAHGSGFSHDITSFIYMLSTCRCTAVAVKGSTEASVNKIEFDSRKIELNDVFVAIRGSVSNGHDFIETYKNFLNEKVNKPNEANRKIFNALKISKKYTIFNHYQEFKKILLD